MNRESESSDGASTPKPQPFRVGTWEVDPRLNRIRGPGGETRVEPKVMKVLLRLARDPGDPVGKDELLRDIWGVATEDVLSRAISHLRRAFSDDAKNPQIIETVYKVGYRLIADVARVRDQTMRRLTAIMFADMVGYTALVQQSETRAREHRTRMREALRTEVAAGEGEILQFYGDGALSVFPSAIEAVRSAIRIQSSLRTTPTVPVRIGLHTGDVVHDEEGVFGDGVNLASRIEALAAPGGILVSGRVFDDIKNQPDIVTVPLGEFELKNVGRPTSVYAVANEGLAVPNRAGLPTQRKQDLQSVAVLPFVNMSSDPENEFFADGITEEIINLLTQVNGLKVTARTSSFVFKKRDEDVRTIANKLGVGHVLEGSVRRSGNRVRISAQLIGAADGYHLFSETYDHTIEDIFATQDEIARLIVGALQKRMDEQGDEPAPQIHRPAVPGRGATVRHMNPAAHTEYLKGLYHWNQWTPDGARAAIADYGRARDLDPQAALPRVGLAMCHGFLGALGQVSPAKAFPKAEDEARRALELESGLAEAHVALAVTELMYHWRFPDAYRHFQKALSMAPGAASVHHFYSMYLLAAGDLSGATEEMETAVALDPLSLILQGAMGSTYMAGGRLDDAWRQFDRALAIDPRFRSALEGKGWVEVFRGDLSAAEEIFLALADETPDPAKGVASLAYVYAKQGRRADALEIVERLEEREQRDPDVALDIDFALIYNGLEDIDAMFRCLESAVQRRLSAILWLRGPPFEWVWKHDRFRQLRERAGLPPMEELDSSTPGGAESAVQRRPAPSTRS